MIKSVRYAWFSTSELPQLLGCVIRPTSWMWKHSIVQMFSRWQEVTARKKRIGFWIASPSHIRKIILYDLIIYKFYQWSSACSFFLCWNGIGCRQHLPCGQYWHSEVWLGAEATVGKSREGWKPGCLCQFGSSDYSDHTWECLRSKSIQYFRMLQWKLRILCNN